MNYQAFSATAQGISHSRHDKCCQDFSLHYPQQSAKNEHIAIAVVADGHGADECFRSEIGAKTAAEIAKDAIRDFAKEFNEPRIKIELTMRELINHIVFNWRNEVTNHYKNTPFTQSELESLDEKRRAKFEAGCGYYKAYGTTLAACAVTDKYWFALHIGDGRITTLEKDGSSCQPVAWDERCFLNQTTSICDDDAAERGRFYFSFHNKKAPPAAIFLCSDGIDDNYPVEENEKHLFKLYRTIAQTFAEDGFDSTANQIKDLVASFAANGKGDDTSLAGIIDIAAVKKLLPVWKKQIANETKASETKNTKPETPPQEKETPTVPKNKAKNIFKPFEKLFPYGKLVKTEIKIEKYEQIIIRREETHEVDIKA